MKKYLFTLLSIFFLLSAKAQNNRQGWSADMEPQKVFIENKGQFDNLNNLPGSKVLFATESFANQVLFTNGGLTFRFEERTRPTKEEREEREEKFKEKYRRGEITHRQLEEEENRMFIRRDYVQMEWVNANPDVTVTATEEVSHYYNYGSISYVKAFKKITYQNLYPGIDVVYEFHPQGGIEYSFTLHPGADASQIKMKYSDVTKIVSEKDGSLLYPTLFGNIIEHAPQTFYANNTQAAIESHFVKQGNEVSFYLANYDKSQQVIIDPWIQTPTFASQWDCVWEVEKDGAGNAYLIGGVTPMQLLKYNPAGALQWTYSTPYDTTSWLGTFATDNAGNSYVTQGSLAAIQKISTSGTLVWSNGNPGGIFSSTEFWSISFNCDQTKLVIGGTGGFLPPLPYIYQVDMNSGNVTSSVQITGGALFPTQEVRSITACGNGKYYFLTHDSIGYINQNFSVCSNSADAVFYTSNGYSLGYKCENFRYNNTGIEAIKTYGSFVYVNRGNRLDKRDFNTGALLTSVAIPGGAFSTSFGSSFNENSGIDIDACGNIYVGSRNQVIKYDQNLSPLATYTTSSNFNVYDVEVSTGGNIIVGGSNGTANSGARQGYIESIAVGACGIVAITCCDASICQAGPYCTTSGPVTLTPSTPGGTWSGTGITNSSTGVFSPSVAGQGTHYVRNTIGCGSDSIAIRVNICAALNACLEQNGNITAGGGTGPYNWSEQDTTQNCSSCIFGCNFPPGCAVTTYAWTQFATGTTVTAPEFPVRVRDVNDNELIIYNTSSLAACAACALTASASSTNATCGNSNGSATAIANGATPTGYLWSNGATTATASNLAAGTYTVTITSSGCTATASVTITATGGVNAVPSSTNAGCNVTNGTATVAASGGNGNFSYLWSNGGNTATISNLAAGTYTVTVTSNGCTATASAVVGSASNVTSFASSSNAGCTNDGSVSVTPGGGNGTFTYLWSNGGTTATISNLSAGTYTVTVTSQGCTATASATVVAAGSVTASASVVDAGCNTTGSATVTPSGGTGSFAYLWSNGGTTASISNLSGGTYNVTVTSGNCTTTAAATVASVGGVSLTPASTNTTCGNNNGSASVTPTTGVSPFNYIWTGGATTSTITGLAAGTYSVTVTDANTCSATLSVVVSASSTSPASITSDKIIMCSGDSAHICVTGTYNSYLWNTGQTGQCIYSKLAGNYYVTVTDVNNCTVASNRITISVYPLPPVSVTVNGDTLTAYNAVTYQWYLNSVVIPNATSNVHIATQPGNYTVEVTDSNGCRAVSTKITITTTGLTELIETGLVKVYPNPLEKGFWNLEVDNSRLGAKVEIFDADGRLVYRGEIKQLITEIELNVASGVYLMKVVSDKSNVTKKLIKL